MQESVKKKLRELIKRYENLEELLSNASALGNYNKVCELSKEHSRLNPIVATFRKYEKFFTQYNDTKLLLKENDLDIKELAKAELVNIEHAMDALIEKISCLLVPRDPHDNANVFLEIRAGSGGTEAAIFSGDLFKMYNRYSELKSWNIDIISHSPGERGGFKEIISKISGRNVYSQLKFESGVHRVQRIPVTESQGRVHTSACTVAIMPEADHVQGIELNPADLKIDVFRASGAGGQHVNKTDSAIRITHIPTGIVAECQDQRSQHKNRAHAMSVLRSKLLQLEIEKRNKEQSQHRKFLIGTGDRSERIRTYNYPNSRVKDHRIDSFYQLEAIMRGNLSDMIQALAHENHTDFLSNSNVDHAE